MKWVSVHIGGQKWVVHLVGRRSKKLGAKPSETVDGVTLKDECAIYIANDTSESARHDTLLHELTHAALYVSGAWQEFKGEDDGAVAESEERAVRALTPVLHRLLLDLGFGFPKGP